MVLCAKVPVKNAQDVKQYIVENGLFNPKYRIKKTKSHIFFPLSAKSAIDRKFPCVDFVDVKSLAQARPKKDMKSLVSGKLTKSEMESLRRAYDTIGSIAILEIPDELSKKEKTIARALLGLHRNIDTVLKKAGIHETEFRTQNMKYLAGKRTKETVHVEHGVRLKLDVEKVYFSPRLASERKRIAQQVKKGEDVLVMFSGCAPYPCIISKHTEARDIVGIELNPAGHDYGVENVTLNRIDNVVLINADVREAVPLLKIKFDRIIMPLPKSAGVFLDSAFRVSKKGTVIHFYAFEEDGDFKAASERIKAACKKARKGCRILRTVRCGQQSPKKFRICVDFKIL